jgi:putative hydrolase
MDREFNQRVAELLRQTADLLAQQQANPFRVNAYRRAAETAEAIDEDLREVLDKEGLPGLVRLPSIGTGIASSIQEIARTGRLSRLDRLRGDAEPEQILEALEVAAHDGRLEAIKGVGPRRAAAIRASLAGLLGRRGARTRANGPGISTLLAVDRDYRSGARGNRLQKIAPRRFNPEGEAWLPILHSDRSGWHFTALFSNTARAHQLGKTDDWVVIYFTDGDHREGQQTVVTETHGPLQGRRVVRGRESECRRYYRRSGRDAGRRSRPPRKT